MQLLQQDNPSVRTVSIYVTSLSAVSSLSLSVVSLLARVPSTVGVPVAHAFAQAGLTVMLLIGMYSVAFPIGLFGLALRQAKRVSGWLTIVGIVVAVLAERHVQRYGAERYTAKPFNIQEMLETV